MIGRRLITAAWLLCTAGAVGTAAAQSEREVERDAGRRLFTSATVPSCAVCHTLRDAGALGAVGPVLDELQPDEARVLAAVRNGLGLMPSFGDKLSSAELALLARYVAQSSRIAPR